MDIRNAVETLKSASRLFQAFKDVGDAAEVALSVSNNVDELKAKVTELESEKLLLATGVSEARSDELRKTAEAKAVGEQTIREYNEKIAAADSDLRRAKAEREVGISQARSNAQAEVQEISRQLQERKDVLGEHARVLENAHQEFIERTKEHRRQIEAKTAQLQAHLDSLRAQVAPLMKEPVE